MPTSNPHAPWIVVRLASSSCSSPAPDLINIMNCKFYRVCGRDAIDENGKCILHSTRDKEVDSFRQALDRHRSKSNDFRYMLFPEGSTPFLDPTFNKRVSFTKATFETTAYLRGVTVKAANFNGTVFKNQAFFTGSRFGKCLCKSAEFREGASFQGCRFEQQCQFTASIFGRGYEINGADFGRAVFDERADFSSTLFHNVALLDSVSFQGPVNFDQARFLGFTNLSADFLGPASFENAYFGGRVDLRGAHFNYAPSFSNSLFLGDVYGGYPYN